MPAPRCFLAACVLAIAAHVAPVPAGAANESKLVEQRLGRTARYLSSDELAGRGLGSPGMDLAAAYIQREFEKIGLKTDHYQGAPLQRFRITLDSKLADGATARFAGAHKQALAVGEDFNPLAIGGSGDFDLPIVFVGYGITAPEAGYDDYDGVDATGKAVILLRHEPQQANPHSAFNGTDHSRHAPFRTKVSNAVQHGASAVIFVTDRYEIDQRLAQAEKRLAAAEEQARGAEEAGGPAARRARDRVERYRRRVEQERDPLMGFTRAGGDAGRDVPVLFCRRGPVDDLLAAVGKPSLAELEGRIDEELQPQSFEFADSRLVGGVEIEKESVETANIVATLAGVGPLADEALVIGAHYDHLGRGGTGSAAPGSREIHNGADDNASGVAALLEAARRLASKPATARRSIVFIAFTGEERGLLGSAEYVRNPLVPLEKTVAMLNFDMVGRLADNKLIINGTGTASEFDGWIDELNRAHGFDLSKSPGGFGPSDHATFYGKQLPVLHFFTDLHEDYHRPDDDFALLNVPGMERIAGFATELAARIAEAPERVTYVEVEQPRIAMGKSDPRPYFGSIPDFAGGGGGYAISGVAPKSPAAEAGLQGGDKIVKLGGLTIGNLEDFDNALRKFSAGDKAPVVVLRDGEEIELQVTLDPPR